MADEVQVIRLGLLSEEARLALEEFVTKRSSPDLILALRRHKLVTFKKDRWVLTAHGLYAARHYKLSEG